MSSMHIQNIIKGKVFLAPMACVNDLAFRSMCWKYGSGLNFTEMVNVNAVERKNKATLKLATTLDEETVAIQLFGSRITAIKKAVKILEHDYDYINPDMFDFNFGCPVKRIMNQGAGCALLKRPSKIGEIISAMRGSTDLPVSAKIRLGLSQKSTNCVKTAKIIEKNGADMIVVHARYQSQGYSGEAFWDKIKEIKENIDIPVVGNGDVLDECSAENMLNQTKCNYIMVGRACMGNPFIFTRINTYLENKTKVEQKDKYELFLEYLTLAKRFELKNAQIKQQAMYFTRGIKHSAKLRDRIRLCKSADTISETFKKHPDDK